MELSALFQAVLVASVSVAAGIFVLAVIRRLLTKKAPSAAALLGVVAASGAILLAASSLGLEIQKSPIWLVSGAFLGFVAVQLRPQETRSLLRGLALAAAGASLYAAFEPNLLAVIFGIGVSGVLLKLAASDERLTENGGYTV